jgi:ATP-dependent exoDNAse (exonuclease V) alpha subunit
MTQQQALAILNQGHNVFLTGPAGSGKTYLLNRFINSRRAEKLSVGITASTGIAATHLGGITIHSWSGMGIKDALRDEDVANLMKRAYLRKRISKTDILIIDEISMLHGFQLELIDRICRVARESRRPFGGIQVVACGDLFQLPPVSKQNGAVQFIIESPVWQQSVFKVCYLEEQFRQTDSVLTSVLNAIRQNDVDEDTFLHLQGRIDSPVAGIKQPTRLFSHNVDVDSVNVEHLQDINSTPRFFDMRMTGHPQLVQTLVNGCLAPQRLELKRGAQVMFVKNNFEKGYVNGTLGTVVDWDNDGLPVILGLDGDLLYPELASWQIEEDGRVLAELTQLPLRLAWAITIHKSQGMSLDAAEVDLGKSFVPGMGYVALSRARTLAGISIRSINNMALRINERVLELDQDLRRQSAASEEVVTAGSRE